LREYCVLLLKRQHFSAFSNAGKESMGVEIESFLRNHCHLPDAIVSANRHIAILIMEVECILFWSILLTSFAHALPGSEPFSRRRFSRTSRACFSFR
jgi:hypothetical protein